MIYGLVLRSIRGEPTTVTLEKGRIDPYNGIHTAGLTVGRNRVLNIKKLAGGSLRPLTWYHLWLDWNSGRLMHVVTTDVKWKSPLTGNNFRRIGSLHTTTKRTIRKFTMCGNEFTWVDPIRNKEVKSQGFTDRRLDACWEKKESGMATLDETLKGASNMEKLLFSPLNFFPMADPLRAEAVAEIMEWAKHKGCPESEEEKVIAWASIQHCTARTEECGWCFETHNVLCEPCRARKLLEKSNEAR